MLNILIMAGGSGERFWPLSTKEHPKQLLKLFSDKPMIRETVDRVLPLVSPSNIFVATNAVQYESIKNCLDNIPNENFIIEPMFKDTAAAIGYGSIYINKMKGDSNIVVLASDHIIDNKEEFHKLLRIANQNVTDENIITFGIIPNKISTAYGYIQVNEILKNQINNVVSFREKPNYETALTYVESGKYLWNSGMFVFNYKSLMKHFEKYAKNHFVLFQAIINDEDKLENIFSKFDKISIDYAIIEKSSHIKVIPATFGWNDVGDYNSFDEIFNKDNYGNVIRNTDYSSIESYNNIVIGNGKHISTIGVEDLIIIQTDNELLILDKKDSQKIKELIHKIGEKK
ncbi:MAG: mannose-1-phosphate guanylyltransferase [Acholeplasmataceae bacterium]